MQKMTVQRGAESAAVSFWGAFVLPVLKYRRLIYAMVVTAATLDLMVSLLLKNRCTSTALVLPGGGRTQVSKLSQAVSTIALWLCGMVNLPFSGSSGLVYWALAGMVLAQLDLTPVRL